MALTMTHEHELVLRSDLRDGNGRNIRIGNGGGVHDATAAGHHHHHHHHVHEKKKQMMMMMMMMMMRDERRSIKSFGSVSSFLSSHFSGFDFHSYFTTDKKPEFTLYRTKFTHAIGTPMGVGINSLHSSSALFWRLPIMNKGDSER